MSSAATLGDSQVIDQMGNVAPEKFQTTVAAAFRKYAEGNGYPIPLAESMVRIEMEVSRYRKPDDPKNARGGYTWVYYRTDDMDDGPSAREIEELGLHGRERIVRAGNLATLTANEAREYGIASRHEPTLDAMLASISGPDTVVQTLEWKAAEKVARFLLGIRGLAVLPRTRRALLRAQGAGHRCSGSPRAGLLRPVLRRVVGRATRRPAGDRAVLRRHRTHRRRDLRAARIRHPRISRTRVAARVRRHGGDPRRRHPRVGFGSVPDSGGARLPGRVDRGDRDDDRRGPLPARHPHVSQARADPARPGCRTPPRAPAARRSSRSSVRAASPRRHCGPQARR